MPKITVCLPVYNEVHYIDNVLSSIINSKPSDQEIIIIDAGSTDGTLKKVRLWQNAHPNIRLINNPRKSVSHGFNIAFAESKGDYIALMGAHAIYPANYIKVGISYLEMDECDAVGGPLLQKGKGFKGKIIAACMSHRYGVGDTAFRTSKEKKYVESVAFAIYKRKVFEKIGLFDIKLIRNQDDEFHYRMNSMGFKILMVPEMQSEYYVREEISGLWKQYFQYGLYKPLVLHNVKSSWRFRHIIPALFVLYLIVLPVLLNVNYLFLIPGILYLITDIATSVIVANSIKEFVFSLIIFPSIHLSYGLGFILGLYKPIKRIKVL